MNRPADAAAPHAADAPRLAHDPAVPRTVFVAPRRAARPIDVVGGAAATDCPFCAGHEHLTPDEVLRSPGGDAVTWTARIIPNRYPVVEAFAPSGSAAAGAAHGVHEVLVESPAHHTSILEIDPAAWRGAWELCVQRLEQLARRGDLAWTTVFKNSGPAAGASLAHVHSQLVGLAFVPPLAAAELAAAHGSVDPFAELLAAAAADGRIVATQDGLVALVPPAPRQPYETWILPRDPRPHLHADGGAVGSLADLTRLVVGRLERLVPGADYNWWLHQAPLSTRQEGPPAAPGAVVPRRWHWHLEILPRLSGFAGFELATGCHITTTGAVESARRLRG